MRDDGGVATGEPDDGPTDEDMVHHAATIPVRFIRDAIDATPDGEVLEIVRLARSEMLRLMREGMPSPHNWFFHRLPHRSALIYFIVGGPEVLVDALPPAEWPPAFLRVGMPPGDAPDGA